MSQSTGPAAPPRGEEQGNARGEEQGNASGEEQGSARGAERGRRPAGSTRRRGALAALALLFVLPLALRLGPIGHGLPRTYVPDAHVVRSALGMLRDRNPVPPVGKYSSYPNLVPYLLVPLYAAHFAGGMATGAWSGPGEYGEALAADPSPAHLLARLLVALFGALTAWAMWRLARELGLRRGAWVAALLVGTGLLHVHFSVQERPWVPMCFFFVLSAWAAAVHVRRGDGRSLVLAGGAAGLAFACHQAGAAAAALPALAWLMTGHGWGGAELVRRLALGVGCALAFLALGLFLGHPYLLVHGATAGDAVAGGGGTDISVGGQGLRIGFRLASASRLALAFLAHDPLLAMLGIAGLGAALAHRAARPAVLFLLAWGLFFGLHENDKIRYLLPVAVLLALPAGFAAERLARRPAGVLALSVLLVFPLAQALRLGQILSRSDTRALAEAELAALLPAGARLAIDRYGPALELDRESLELLADLRARTGGELSTRERSRLELLEHLHEQAYREGPAGGWNGNAVLLQELLEFVERDRPMAGEGPGDPRDPRTLREGVHVRAGLEPLGATPAELLDALGVTHLLFVNRLGPGTERHLLADLVAGRDPQWVIDPWAGSPRPGGARLPMEMEWPVISLWSLERPGPWLALYPLR